jgi:hypothetical protein
VISAQKVQRHIGLVADYPAIVRFGRDIEQHSLLQLDHSAIVERGSRYAGHDKSDVLDMTAGRAYAWSNVQRPLPSRLIRCTSDRYASEMHEFKLPHLHLAKFVGVFEAFEDDVVIHGLSLNIANQTNVHSLPS